MMGALWTLLLTGSLLGSIPDGWAQTGADSANERLDRQPDSESVRPASAPRDDASPRTPDAGVDPENKLFLPFLRHMAGDQRQFWSSPQELRRPAALKTFLPFAGLTAALIAGDRSLAKQIPASQVQRSRDISNYAVFSLVGAAAGSYAFGEWAGNDHLRETGFLSGETALNSTLISYAFKEATLRQRPYEETNCRLARNAHSRSPFRAIVMPVLIGPFMFPRCETTSSSTATRMRTMTLCPSRTSPGTRSDPASI
jgi:hypothetical protein